MPRINANQEQLAAKARHRYHTKLTKKLNDAQLALQRAEGLPSVPHKNGQIGIAKDRVARALNEIRLFEKSLEDERRLNAPVENFTQIVK